MGYGETGDLGAVHVLSHVVTVSSHAQENVIPQPQSLEVKTAQGPMWIQNPATVEHRAYVRGFVILDITLYYMYNYVFRFFILVT